MLVLSCCVWIFIVFTHNTILCRPQAAGTKDSPNKLISLMGCDQCLRDVINVALKTVNSSLGCHSSLESDVSPLLDGIQIYLFYGPHKDDRQIETITNVNSLLTEHWNSEISAVVYVPGWLSFPDEGIALELVEAYLSTGKYNVLVVDWTVINTKEYGTVAPLAPLVGARVAEALRRLQDSPAFRLAHLVGHSMGAHVAGHIGRNLHTPPPFLAGLDPAGPLISPTMFQCVEGLSSTDAQHVVVLHTDWNKLGTNEHIGVVNFMANGGHRTQPGCSNDELNPKNYRSAPACSHDRSLLFWCDAVARPESVVGRLCPTWEHFITDKCSHNPTLDVTKIATTYGTYYFTTNPSKPFGKGFAGI